MDARAALNRSVSTGLHLARGTADRVVRLAGPPLGKVAGSVIARVRRPGPPATPDTFTPSKRRPKAEPTSPKVTIPTTEPTTEKAGPSPAKVARNIGPPRPTAAPARKRTAPKSVPGAKLPPPRPSTS
jgi:hypothetical protein